VRDINFIYQYDSHSSTARSCEKEKESRENVPANVSTLAIGIATGCGLYD
jgi:hypothetical protein